MSTLIERGIYRDGRPFVNRIRNAHLMPAPQEFLSSAEQAEPSVTKPHVKPRIKTWFGLAKALSRKLYGKKGVVWSRSGVCNIGYMEGDGTPFVTSFVICGEGETWADAVKSLGDPPSTTEGH